MKRRKSKNLFRKKIKKIEQKTKDREDISAVLEAQIKETENKKLEFKSWVKEQGEIWKTDDEKAHEQIKANKKIKKFRQREIKEILDKQVREKEEKILADLQLSPAESKINKHIVISAIKVLEETR